VTLAAPGSLRQSMQPWNRRGAIVGHMADSQPPEQLDEAIRGALVRSVLKKPLGFFFDFDGVLAPIEGEPDHARPIDGIIEQLEQLAALVHKVAIVSARPVSFLAEHFQRNTRISLYGLYGFETFIDGVAERNRAAATWESAIREVTTAAGRELPEDVLIEEKPVSVALHYRRRPRHRRAVEEWAKAKARNYGLSEQHGRMVIELKPPIPIDKGTVLAGEITDLQCAWYFGDDISDVKGFEALRNQQEQDPSFLGVCVAVASTEIGGILEDQADFTLASPLKIPVVLTNAIDLISTFD
jgi:trehalose 6-phosphate phosphatase